MFWENEVIIGLSLEWLFIKIWLVMIPYVMYVYAIIEVFGGIILGGNRMIY